MSCVLSANAQQSRECKPQDFFSTERIKSNLAIQYSVLSLVTRDNYAEMTKAMSASIPGYFTGNYDEFSQKREKFFSLFQESSSFSSSSDFYRHALSQEGAQAYAQCVGSQKNEPFVAYIYNQDPKSGTRLSIGLSTSVGGNTTVKWEILGEKPVTGFPTKGTLTPNSSDATQYQYDRRKDFQITIRAKNTQTGQTYVATLLLPPYRIFSLVTEWNDDDRVIVGCKAGCQGNTAGCQIVENGEKLAQSGWSYLQNSPTLLGSSSPWRYSLSRFTMGTWSTTPDADSRNIKISSNIASCEGQNGDTQGYRIDTYGIRRTRQLIVEDTAVKISVDAGKSIVSELGKAPNLPPLPWGYLPRNLLDFD